MERPLTYKITNPMPGQKVSGFLKTKGFSTQNLINLKKDPESVQVNGKFVYQNYILQDGDALRITICETEGSEQILPVELPLDIVYEDEDLLVINKIDLAPYVGASLEVMERDSRKMRGERPFVFTNIRGDEHVDTIVEWIKKNVLLEDLQERRNNL